MVLICAGDKFSGNLITESPRTLVSFRDRNTELISVAALEDSAPTVRLIS